jgi:hypothetical protein
LPLGDPLLGEPRQPDSGDATFGESFSIFGAACMGEFGWEGGSSAAGDTFSTEDVSASPLALSLAICEDASKEGGGAGTGGATGAGIGAGQGAGMGANANATRGVFAGPFEEGSATGWPPPDPCVCALPTLTSAVLECWDSPSAFSRTAATAAMFVQYLDRRITSWYFLYRPGSASKRQAVVLE